MLPAADHRLRRRRTRFWPGGGAASGCGRDWALRAMGGRRLEARRSVPLTMTRNLSFSDAFSDLRLKIAADLWQKNFARA